jgi:autoinducer 2-degrading protein
MNVTLVEINIKPERVDEFLEVFRANHEGALQEPGNLRFDVLQDPEVKTRFFIYEAYIDDDAVLAHKKTPHYLACVAKLEELMSQPRRSAALSACCRRCKTVPHANFAMDSVRGHILRT